MTSALTHENWSRNVRKIDDRFTNFFQDYSLSDVTFIVGMDCQEIRGHKFVLSAYSWEFYIVFCLLKLDKDALRVPDVVPEIFKSFLGFFYMGTISLDGSNVWDILKLACRFSVDQLVEVCSDFLCKAIQENTCLEYYTKITSLKNAMKDTVLEKKILEVIGHNIDKILNNPNKCEEFTNFPQNTLKKLIESDYLLCDEKQVFDAAMIWAKSNCSRAEIACESKNLREILGEVFKEIRFPILGMENFIEILAKYKGLLTDEEVAVLAKFMTENQEQCPGFKHKFRMALGSVGMFTTMCKNGNLERVECFPLKRNIVAYSSEMAISFIFSGPNKLLGFGFYSKVMSDLNVINCTLRNNISNRSKEQEMDVLKPVFCFKRANDEFYCCEVYFQYVQKLIFFSGYCHLLLPYLLYCKFDKKLPMLDFHYIPSKCTIAKLENNAEIQFFKTLNPSEHNCRDGEENVYHPIPYLIFEK